MAASVSTFSLDVLSYITYNDCSLIFFSFTFQITLINWAEYLCDFLEMKDIPELTSHMGTIRRGHYGLLDPHAKLHIFRELVSEVLSTDAVRQQLDEYIEQQHALVAAKRGEAVEEARKKRNERQNMEAESNTKELVQGHDLEKRVGNLYNDEDDCNHGQNGDVPKGKELISCNGNRASSTDHPPSSRYGYASVYFQLRAC